MSAPSSSRVRPAVHARQGLIGPVAVSSLESTLTEDPLTLALLRQASACRHAAADAFLRSREFDREARQPDPLPYVPKIAADLAALGGRLEQAACHLEEDAHDPHRDTLDEVRAWLVAGGVVVLKQADGAGRIVVGDAQQASEAANDRWTWVPLPVRTFVSSALRWAA